MLGEVGLDFTKTIDEAIDYISSSFEALMVQGKRKDYTIHLWQNQEVGIPKKYSILVLSVCPCNNIHR